MINRVGFERLSRLIGWLQRERVEMRLSGGAGQLPRQAGIIARFGVCQLAWKARLMHMALSYQVL